MKLLSLISDRICYYYHLFKPTFEMRSAEVFGSISHFGFHASNTTIDQFSKEISLLARDAELSVFDLLGSGKICVRIGDQSVKKVNLANRAYSGALRTMLPSNYKEIDWQADFKSGHRWNIGTWYKNVKYGDLEGVDVKVPWELARMQHLPVVALASQLDDCREGSRFQLVFESHLIDFISNNPVCYGVNWSCTMDVAIRVSNWLVAYDLMKSGGIKFGSTFLEVFQRSIVDHGRFIRANLEWNESLRGNHYLANLCGLIFCACYLREYDESESWLRFAKTQLILELDLQFNKDGSNFEGSVAYHRLSTEMILYTALVLERARSGWEQFSDFDELVLSSEELLKVSNVLVGAKTFLNASRHPDGVAVQIGDNDAGRFIKFVDGETKYGYLIDALEVVLGKTVLNRIDSSVVNLGVRFMPESQWCNHNKICQFPDFGLFVLVNESCYVAIRYGSVGQAGFGGHAHNDQLSFELSAFGVRFVIDSGTGVYTPDIDLRNRFRSVQSHNVVAVNGSEQSDWLSGREGLFSLSKTASLEPPRHTDNCFEGEVSRSGWSFRRSIVLRDNVVHLTDFWIGVNAKLYLHFHPNVSLERQTNQLVVAKTETVEMYLSFPEGELALQGSEYSRSYGLVEPSQKICFKPKTHEIKWQITLEKTNL